ncbi:MAG: hexapeptide transferase [Wenzhouxiangella sp.]|nr:MAG: hexapeptide transferase [Wenzhouxiangella sp.]
MNWPMLRRFMRHTRKESGMGSARQVFGFLSDSLRYNISPLEWYQFGFVGMDAAEKATWAGTGTMYEFQRRVNPPAGREILNDKRAFYRAYREFCRHGLWSLRELQDDSVLVQRILAQHEKLVFKDATGNCGTSVCIVPSAERSAPDLTRWMSDNGFDMVESFIEQHPDMQALSPSGVNTVRIFTLLDEQGAYHALGCRLRISVDSPVDNLAAGNLAAPIDEETGQISGPGIYSDITRKPESSHPVTGVSIEGFQVPYWAETLELVKQASLKHPQNRSIGWDVAITENGPGLIEGNHDWCKLVWQLPVKRGLKPLLEDASLEN